MEIAYALFRLGSWESAAEFMQRPHRHTAFVIALSLAVGAFSWQLQLRQPLAMDTSRLGRLPFAVDRWSGADIPMQGSVEEMLNADFNIQRVYLHPVGGRIWLYVGYYGTERGGRPEHTPWVCYPSNGWKILRRSVIDDLGGELTRVNEILVEKDGERRLVHFWYQSSRRAGMLGEFDQAWERLWNRVESGRADGSLVRLSTRLQSADDERTARLQMIAFGRRIVPLLQMHWPAEASTS